jgi:hypothetical protein
MGAAAVRHAGPERRSVRVGGWSVRQPYQDQPHDPTHHSTEVHSLRDKGTA